MLEEKLLRTGTLFSGLDVACVRRLAEHAEVRSLSAGEVLYRAGALHRAVVYLTEGRMALYRKQGPVTLLLGLVGAPSLFGDAECAAAVNWMCSVRAEEDCWCLLIENEAFLRAIDEEHNLASRMYRDASVRHLLANHTAQTIALYDVRTRLLRLLLDHASLFGRREGKSAVIERTLSRVAIAASLGVTRKTVTRTIGPLEEDGTIGYTGEGFIVIQDLDNTRSQLPAYLFGLSSKLGTPVMPVIDQFDEDDE